MHFAGSFCLVYQAKLTNSKRYILHICDFSRGRLNVRLNARIQPLLRGHRYGLFIFSGADFGWILYIKKSRWGWLYIPLCLYYSNLFPKFIYSKPFSIANTSSFLPLLLQEPKIIYQKINSTFAPATKKQLPKREDTLYLWP